MPETSPRKPAGRPPKSKVPAERVKQHSMPVLRLLAENIYVLSDQGIGYADIAKMPEFAGIDVVNIRAWGQHGEWPRKRKEHLGRLQKMIMDHLGGLIMQQSKKQLQMYDALHDQLASYVLPNETGHVSLAPKSAEGAISAMIKVEAVASRMRQRMAESLGSSIVGPAQPVAAPAPVPLSDDDARHLAHLLLAKQHNLDGAPSQAAIAAPHADDAPPKHGPDDTTIEGEPA